MYDDNEKGIFHASVGDREVVVDPVMAMVRLHDALDLAGDNYDAIMDMMKSERMSDFYRGIKRLSPGLEAAFRLTAIDEETGCGEVPLMALSRLYLELIDFISGVKKNIGSTPNGLPSTTADPAGVT